MNRKMKRSWWTIIYRQGVAILLPFLVSAAPTFGAAGLLIYDNGPFINRPGQGPGGADGSVVQTSLGFGDSAWPAAQAYGSRVADDFTILSGQPWFVSRIRFFAEFPLAPTDASFSGISLRIWNGRPDVSSSQVIWGDSEANVKAGSAFTGAYRYWEGAPNTLEPIFWVDAGVNQTLWPGTYWLDWSFSGPQDVFGDPYQIPVTVNGQLVTGNALWYTGAWSPLVDIGAGTSSYAQGLPFQIYTAVPPINDHIDDAISIRSLPYTNLVDTTAATVDEDDPGCGSAGETVWYKIRSTRNQDICVSAAESDYPVSLSAYTGDSRTNLNQLTCKPQFVLFPAQAGKTYYILAGSSGARGGGLLRLNIWGLPPLQVVTVLDRVATWETRNETLELTGRVWCSRPCSVRLSATVEQNTRHPIAVGSSDVSFQCSGRCRWNTSIPLNSLFRGRNTRVRLAFEANDVYGMRLTGEVLRETAIHITRAR
jgi:hypothetical protein